MKNKLSIIFVALLILMLFVGCSSGKSYDMVNESKSAEDYKIETAENFGEVTPMEYETTATIPTTAKLPENVKLIYRADISMETTTFEAAVSSLSELVGKIGGYFEASSLDNYSNYRYAYYTVRVPAEKFEEFCSGVGGYCQINNISRSAEDISEIYYDTESRLVTQQTKLERLQELLAKAESMEDIITIESAISETELLIENLTSTIRSYDSLVGYSTINISLREVYRLSGTEEPAIGFGAKLAAAFKAGCKNFVDDAQRLSIEFARNWVGWLIFLVIVAIVIIVVVRKVRRRRRKRAEILTSQDSAEK